MCHVQTTKISFIFAYIQNRAGQTESRKKKEIRMKKKKRELYKLKRAGRGLPKDRVVGGGQRGRGVSLRGVYFKFEQFGANACGDCACFSHPFHKHRPPTYWHMNVIRKSRRRGLGLGVLRGRGRGRGRCCGNVCGCEIVTNYVQQRMRPRRRRWLPFNSFRCVRRFKQPLPALKAPPLRTAIA